MTSAEGLKEAESGQPFCISASLPLDWVFSHGILKPVSCFMCPLHFLAPLYCLCLGNVSMLIVHKVIFFQCVNFPGPGSLENCYGMLPTSNYNYLLSRIFRIWGSLWSTPMARGAMGDILGMGEWSGGKATDAKTAWITIRREGDHLPCIPSHLLNSWTFTMKMASLWFDSILLSCRYKDNCDIILVTLSSGRIVLKTTNRRTPFLERDNSLRYY